MSSRMMHHGVHRKKAVFPETLHSVSCGRKNSGRGRRQAGVGKIRVRCVCAASVFPGSGSVPDGRGSRIGGCRCSAGVGSPDTCISCPRGMSSAVLPRVLLSRGFAPHRFRGTGNGGIPKRRAGLFCCQDTTNLPKPCNHSPGCLTISAILNMCGSLREGGESTFLREKRVLRGMSNSF